MLTVFRAASLGALALAAALLTAPDAAAKKRPAPAPAVAASSTLSPLSLRVQRVTLDNGLTVLLHEDHSVPTIAFWQWYRVGSRNERLGLTGISHFFEHMMFNGSKNVPPKEYDRILESNGGYSNAFTDHDMTAYFEEIASDRLGVVLRLDSDRMAALSLLPEQLKSEIDVVKEERRYRVDDDIRGMLEEPLWATAFEASPYHWPVIGWMGDLNRITREDMVEYFRIHYAPDNCILALAGDFDSKAALDSIRAYFGSIPRQIAPPEPVDSEPEQNGERRVEVRYPAQNVTFLVGYKAPAAKGVEVPVLDVLRSILGDGESSRLHQALVYEGQMAIEASCAYQARLNPGLMEFTVEMKPGRGASEGLSALDSVLVRLAAEGPGERELQKARNQLEAAVVRSLKTNNGVGQQLAYYEHVFGDYRTMFQIVERYRAVTADDCRRVAKQLFDAKRRTISVLVPAEGAAP
jgi:predicted Zn-dependent peptidase